MGNQYFTVRMNNSSRCTLFNTDSDDYRCIFFIFLTYASVKRLPVWIKSELGGFLLRSIGLSITKVTIIAVKRATATFSLIGCLFMLFVIWLLRRYNSLAQKMILSLTVAAFFDSIAYVMGEVHPEGALCDFQAWWLTYFDWCALAWVCLITLNLYLNLVREMRTEKLEVLQHSLCGVLPPYVLVFTKYSSFLPPSKVTLARKYHLAAWGVPCLMSSLPLFGGYYGPAGAWCWITDDHVAWRFGIWYIPLFTLIFLMMCCNVRIIYVANKRVQSWSGTFNPERERWKVSLAEEIKPLKWYPSVYLLVSLFPLINRLHNALYPEQPVFALTFLHVLSAPLHGLANSFVFGLDKDTWGQLSFTGIQLALRSRFCDRTQIREYHPGAVRYAPAEEGGFSDSDDDTTVLFYSPDMTLKDRGP